MAWRSAGGISRLVLPSNLSTMEIYKRLIVLCVLEIGCAAIAIGFANMVGTGVCILPDRIRVREWYGAESTFRISLPVKMVRARTPFPHYVIQLGTRRIPVNLGTPREEDEEAESLESLLNELAGRQSSGS